MSDASPAPAQKLDLRGLRKLAQPPEEPQASGSPLTPRDLPLRIVYVAPDGQRHEDTVISRIMSAEDRAEKTRIMIALVGRSGGVWAALPITDQAYVMALSTVAIQLRKIPEWLNKWAGEDDALLMSLFEACERHAAAYFRRDAGASPEDAARSRVLVTPVDAPRAA